VRLLCHMRVMSIRGQWLLKPSPYSARHIIMPDASQSLDLLHNPFRGLTAVLGTPLRLEFLKRRLCKRSIGPAHKIWIRGIAVPSVRAFATPLGKIPLDTTVIEEIAALPSAAIDDKPHANEHALEVELPFLQTVLGSARIVPLLVGSATPTEVAEVLSRPLG
jgi:Memo-like protein